MSIQSFLTFHGALAHTQTGTLPVDTETWPGTGTRAWKRVEWMQLCTSFPRISQSWWMLALLAHISRPAFTKLCLCRSHSPVPHCAVGHPASHSIHKLWEHPTVWAGDFVGFVLPQETLTQPHRDRDCENSGSNLQSASRLSGSHFNSQGGSLLV